MLLPTDVGIVADPKHSLRSLIASLREKLDPEVSAARDVRLAALRVNRGAARRRERDASGIAPMSVDRAAAELNQVLPPDAIVVDEGVRSSTRLMRHLDIGDSQLMLRSSGGALGWGVPAAVGACLGQPGRPVVALVGDGSYQFSVQALWSAVQQDAHLVVVVLDNGGYLAVKRAIEGYLGVPEDSRLHPGTRLPGYLITPASPAATALQRSAPNSPESWQPQ